MPPLAEPGQPTKKPTTGVIQHHPFTRNATPCFCLVEQCQGCGVPDCWGVGCGLCLCVLLRSASFLPRHRRLIMRTQPGEAATDAGHPNATIGSTPGHEAGSGTGAAHQTTRHWSSRQPHQRRRARQGGALQAQQRNRAVWLQQAHHQAENKKGAHHQAAPNRHSSRQQPRAGKDADAIKARSTSEQSRPGMTAGGTAAHGVQQQTSDCSRQGRAFPGWEGGVE